MSETFAWDAPLWSALRFEPVPSPYPKYGASRQIIADIARAHGLTYADLVGPRTLRRIVVARWEAMRAVLEHSPHLSSTHIGRLFNRDHTSVLYALGRTAAARRRAERLAEWSPSDDLNAVYACRRTQVRRR